MTWRAKATRPGHLCSDDPETAAEFLDDMSDHTMPDEVRLLGYRHRWSYD